MYYKWEGKQTKVTIVGYLSKPTGQATNITDTKNSN